MLGWLAATLLAGCQRSAQPVRVGFLGGLSGTVAELGVNGRNGVLLAVETLNAEGRERYELLVEDDQQDGDKARAALRALADRQVAFVVGPMTSAVAVAVLPEAQALALPLISPTATTDELSGKPDMFFRVATDASGGARQLAERLFRRGVRSVAELMDERNSAYSLSFGGALAARMRELGGEVTAELRYGAPNTDFDALARKLLERRPQAVLVVAGVGDSALLAQHVRRLDPAVQLAVTPWAANQRLLQLGGRAVEGCIALQALDLDGAAPAYRAFRKRYADRFGEDPATPAVQAYEAAMLGAQALRRAGSPSELAATLAKPARWSGLYSDIDLDANGDTARPLHMAQVREGRFAPLPP
jgi:branched-chain amino acid transport system substrate-binding protein